MVQSRVGLSGLLRGILVFALAIIALAGVDRAHAQAIMETTVPCDGGPVLAGGGRAIYNTADFDSYQIDLAAMTCEFVVDEEAWETFSADVVGVGIGETGNGSGIAETGFHNLRVAQTLLLEHSYNCYAPMTDFDEGSANGGTCRFGVRFESSSSTEVRSLVQFRDKTTNELYAEFEAVNSVVPGPAGNRQEVTIPAGVKFYTPVIPPEVTGVGFLQNGTSATSAAPGSSFSLSVMFDQAMDTSSEPTLQFYDGLEGSGSELDLTAWRTGGEWFSGDTLYSATFTVPDPLSASAAIRSVTVSGIDDTDDVALVDHTENVSFTILQNILPNVSVDPLVTTDTTPPLAMVDLAPARRRMRSRMKIQLLLKLYQKAFIKIARSW